MSAADWYLAVFSLGVGVSLPAYWAVALATRRVPEVAEGRRDFWFHIAAEVATGGVFVAAGVGIVADRDASWVAPLSALALGMLAYSLIQSPGHYLERGRREMLWMFAGVWALAVPAVVLRFSG